MKIILVSNLHDFSLWVFRERLGVKRYSGKYVFYVFYISNTITRTPPIVGSAFPRGSRRVLLYGRRRRTGMAINHTPILLYGEDQT
ncbi:hypothetical protein H8356DRAFT_1355863 [Neocallimastix lanati (nom. inval.)]|nr:hypothetical protein H8356DRAFT_1355863 [Neocallimastix sp. JGI-2020a]